MKFMTNWKVCKRHIYKFQNSSSGSRSSKYFYLPGNNFVWLLLKWLIFYSTWWPSWKYQPYWICSKWLLGPNWKLGPKESSGQKWHFYLPDNNLFLLPIILKKYLEAILKMAAILDLFKVAPICPNWIFGLKESSGQKWHFYISTWQQFH